MRPALEQPDDIIGLIYCDRASLLEQFTENDLRLLTLLANLAAIKIENARLIEESSARPTGSAREHGPGRPDPEELPAARGPGLRALRHQRQRPGLPPRRRRLLRLHPHRHGPPGRRHRRRLRGRASAPPCSWPSLRGALHEKFPDALRPRRARGRAQRLRLHQLGQPLLHLLLPGHPRPPRRTSWPTSTPATTRRSSWAAKGRPGRLDEHGLCPGDVPGPGLRREEGRPRPRATSSASTPTASSRAARRRRRSTATGRLERPGPGARRELPAREIMERDLRGRLRLQRLLRGRRRHDPGRRQAEPMSAGRGGRP
ncbi:MAG: hypothetical protein MZW92_02300 [Comamonadaceae bacterium]|nr:hypothetical protein [Comamonadaceae bacterium]